MVATLLSPQVKVQIGDLLVVTNNEDKPRKIRWNSRVYELIPARPAFVPAEAVFSWFGDVRSLPDRVQSSEYQGETVFIADRPTEIRRLRRKYGVQSGDDSTFFGYVNTPRRGEAEEGDLFVVPDVTITTAEGEPVLSVFSDPEGSTVSASTSTVSDQDEMLQELIRQRRQIDALMAQVNGDDPVIEALEPPADDG